MRFALMGTLLLTFAGAAVAAPGTEDLTDADRARLAKEKILVGRDQFNSVSTPYRSNEYPVFLTSDSALFAFHSLLREAVARLEWSRGAALRAALPKMQAGIDAVVRRHLDLDAVLEARAERRARIVLATARILLGDEPGEKEAEIVGPALAEAHRVEAANTIVTPPAWYGSPSPGFVAVDYTRFKPTGILAEIPETARIARAASWLAFVPFRLDRDEELVAFLVIAATCRYAHEAEEAFGSLPELLGPGEDPSLLDAPDLPEHLGPGELAKIRKALLSRAIPDRVMDLPTAPGERPAITARILPLAAPDDSALLQVISNVHVLAGDDRLPSALAVAAALGSREALVALPEVDRAVVKSFRGTGGKRSIHDRYLHCLGLLFRPLPKAAPALFSGEAWRTKTLQTVLSGYTYWRHAFDLRIKDGTRYLGSRDEVGFVEPAPAFFRALGRMITRTGELLGDAGIGGDSYQRVVAATVFELAADAVARTDPAGEGEEGAKEYWQRLWKEVEREPILVRTGNSLFSYLYYKYKKEPAGGRMPRTPEDRERWVRHIRGRAAELREGAKPEEPSRLVADPPFSESFTKLAKMMRELARLADHQLSGEAFSEKQDKWIRGYGAALSRILGEGDNPADDAPVAVGIFSDPARGLHLVEGVGRPRALYILYPANGKEILCRGVVIPWYETTRKGVPTDLEWKALLDSDDAPEIPAAVRSIYAE